MLDSSYIAEACDENLLLTGLPRPELDQLRPHLRPAALSPQQVLFDADRNLDQVYFLRSGYVSLMMHFEDGFQAETGQVGREGMVGIPLIMRGGGDTSTAVVQVCGTALCLPASMLLRALQHMPMLQRRLVRYVEISRVQAMRLAACNSHHGLDARLARHLLEMRDRCGSNLPITHQTLATLLCAHRPSISVSTKRLERAGLICCTNGSIKVVDSPGLHQASCRCYTPPRGITSD